MICQECGSSCGTNARLTVCPECERRIRGLLTPSQAPIRFDSVQQGARLIRWFEAQRNHAQHQLEQAHEEAGTAWKKCDLRRRNSIRYIAEIRRLRATKKDLTIRLLRAAHANVELRGEVQGLKRRPPEVLTCHLLDTSPYLLALLDRARNHVTDPTLRAEITAICPPKARPTEDPE